MGIEFKNGYLVINAWHAGIFIIPMENADGFFYSPEERGLYGCEFTVQAKAYGPETGYVVEGELWSNGTVEDFKIVVFEEEE